MRQRRITPHLPVTAVYGDEFDRGKNYTNWRPQGGRDWLLIYTEGGSGMILANGENYYTRPGDALIYEPRFAQDYSTSPRTGAWLLLWAHFLPRPSWRSWMEWPLLAPGTRLVNIPADVRRDFTAAMRRMIRFCRRKDAAQLAMCALEEALLWGHEAASRHQEPSLDERVLKARRILADEFKKPFSLPELARRCGLSVSRLSHLFKQTGETPQQFLEQQRISHARQLLRLTNLSIEEIAADCGYEDPFYFTKRFRRSQEMSPSEFRRR